MRSAWDGAHSDSTSGFFLSMSSVYAFGRPRGVRAQERQQGQVQARLQAARYAGRGWARYVPPAW
jgi:hypothetical protein